MAKAPRAVKLTLGVLAGVVGLALFGFGALAVARYAGWPWNMMREQVVIRSQESPPLPSVAAAVPFALGGWPRQTGRTPSVPGSIHGGERIYRENCLFCHGPEGRGDGPMAAKLRNRPENLASWKVHYRKRGDLFQWIARPGGSMPPFEHRLDEEEIWAVVRLIQESYRPAEPPPWIASRTSMGESLYQALACAQCHGPGREEEAAGIPPSLDYAGSKLKPEWVVEYLLDPYHMRWKSEGVRPNMRMPEYSLTRTEAEALATYLALRVDSQRFPRDVLEGPGTLDEGREAFESYQCRGCHTLNGDGQQIGPDLSGAGLRLQSAYLYQFLLDPKGVVPGTSMKDLDLWEDEALALVRYLQSLRVVSRDP